MSKPTKERELFLADVKSAALSLCAITDGGIIWGSGTGGARPLCTCIGEPYASFLQSDVEEAFLEFGEKVASRAAGIILGSHVTGEEIVASIGVDPVFGEEYEERVKMAERTADVSKGVAITYAKQLVKNLLDAVSIEVVDDGKGE